MIQIFYSSDPPSTNIVSVKIFRHIRKVFRHRTSHRDSLEILTLLLSKYSNVWDKADHSRRIRFSPHYLHLFSEISGNISFILPKRVEFSMQIVNSALSMLASLTDRQRSFFSLFYFSLNFFGCSPLYLSILKKMFFWFSEWMIATFSLDKPSKESAGKIYLAGGLNFLLFIGSVGHLLGVVMSFDPDKHRNSLLQLYITKVPSFYFDFFCDSTRVPPAIFPSNYNLLGRHLQRSSVWFFFYLRSANVSRFVGRSVVFPQVASCVVDCTLGRYVHVGWDSRKGMDRIYNVRR
jgi:hypothetical protein